MQRDSPGSILCMLISRSRATLPRTSLNPKAGASALGAEAFRLTGLGHRVSFLALPPRKVHRDFGALFRAVTPQFLVVY